MGDIDFEEQLEQERLAREQEEARLLDSHPHTRTDPDGTVYEWDVEKKAWFPKIDADFIAQYQMNYGVQGDMTEGSGDLAQSAGPTDYENYLKYYHEAGQERTMGKKKKEVTKEDTHEEMVEKLKQLESSIQQGEDANGQGGESQGDEGWSDNRKTMENYTEEEKKQYNEYWSYYYGTEYHDYYADCMNQSYTTEQSSGVEGQTDASSQKEGSDSQMAGKENQSEEGAKGDKKKGKKRKGAAQQQRPEGWFEVEETHNTNVYVSGLPLDVTDEEFKELMNKCGLIMYDPHTRKPKLKLYRDENGDPKGDGRCCYIKIESVDLALKILDGCDVRGHKIKVERASFHMKGNYDPSKKKKKLSNKEKRKFREKQAKLFDWRPERPQGTRPKHEKIVILKNLFDPTAFELNPALINTVREDVRSECSNYGDVKKVTVYDRHPDGVVSVAYKEAEEADLCVTSLHQRWFAKRRILASAWDGHTKYEVQETEKEREERLKKWENFLETDAKSSKETDSVVHMEIDGKSEKTDSKSTDINTETVKKTEETENIAKTTNEKAAVNINKPAEIKSEDTSECAIPKAEADTKQDTDKSSEIIAAETHSDSVTADTTSENKTNNISDEGFS